MYRVFGRAPTIAIMLVSMLLVGGLVVSARAQDATPPAGGFEIAPGVTAELLPVPDDPPALYRLHFAPGVVYPFSGAPSLDVVYVEAGTLSLRVDMALTVAQVGTLDAAGENVAADTEVTVTAGDYFVLPPFAAGEVRNDGDETATVAVAGFVPTAMGTPAAD